MNARIIDLHDEECTGDCEAIYQAIMRAWWHGLAIGAIGGFVTGILIGVLA